MGIIRGGLFIFVCILLFISLIVGGVFLILSLSLSYENVNSNFKEILKNQKISDSGVETMIEEVYPSMIESCANSEFIEYADSNINITIPCSVVNQGSPAVIDYGYDAVTKEVYYRQYECKFFDCFDNPNGSLVIISNHGRTYWLNKFFISSIIILIILLILFFLAHKKYNFFIFSGIVFILSSFVLLNIQKFLIPIIKTTLNISTQQLNQLGEVSLDTILNLFFAKSPSVFIMFFIVGIIFIVIGVLIRLWILSYGVSKFFGIGKNSNSANKKIKELEKKVSEDKKDIKEIKKK